MKHLTCCLLCFLFSTSLFSQVPATELYSFEITWHDTQYVVHSPVFLSGLNPGGYTNQPLFTDTSSLLVSMKFSDSTQHDLYALDLLSGSYYPMTQTRVNEFSPGYKPGTNALCYVAQDVHADTTDQRFIVHDAEDYRSYSEPFPSHRNIGYYRWLDSDNVAFFLSDEPPRLAFGNIETGRLQFYLSNVGRCFQGKGDGKLFYVHKYNDDFWYIKSYVSAKRQSEIVTQTLPGSEDFAIAPDGTFFMGKGSVLYVFRPGKDKEWKAVADLAPYGITQITRLAFNDQFKMALVNVTN